MLEHDDEGEMFYRKKYLAQYGDYATDYVQNYRVDYKLYSLEKDISEINKKLDKILKKFDLN